MDLVNVKTLSSGFEKGLRQVIEGMAGEVDVVSRDIQGLLQVIELLDMLENHGGFAHSLLPHDTDEAVGPVDSVMKFPDIVHRGQG